MSKNIHTSPNTNYRHKINSKMQKWERVESHHRNEINRIQSLHDLDILDTPPDERFDRITRTAQMVLDVPIALVSLVDTDRQWFKSCVGLNEKEMPRSMSFCSHAIFNEEILIVEDATKDSRFADNPLVTGKPFIRFYAGKPIKGPDEQFLGTFCIMDKLPRKLSKPDKNTLSDFASWIEDEIKNASIEKKLKKTESKLTYIEKTLNEKNENLEKVVRESTAKLIKAERLSAIGELSSRMAHDLRNPLTVISSLNDMLYFQLSKHMDEKQKRQCNLIQNAIQQMDNQIKDVLQFVKTGQLILRSTKVSDIIEVSLTAIQIPSTISVIVDKPKISIVCDREKIIAIVTNLLKNAVDEIKPSGTIEITVDETSTNVRINVIDSGKGIPDEIKAKIFEPLFTTKTSGTGLGLATCQNIAHLHEGTITVSNNPTTFSLSIPKNLEEKW